MNNKISVLLSEEQIDERIAELGAQISKDYEGEEVFLVCTLKGACFFACELALKYNVSYQQVYNWTNKYAQQGEAGLEDRRGQRVAQQQPWTPEEEMKIRIAQLEHENYMLRMERDLLKKLDEIERRRG